MIAEDRRPIIPDPATAAPAPEEDGRARVLFPYVGGDGPTGGSHLSSLKLAAALAGHDRYRPIVGIHRDGGPLVRLIHELGLEYELLPAPEILQPVGAVGTRLHGAGDVARYLASALPRMTGYLRRRGIDLVHTNDGRIHVRWAVAAALARTPLIWHHRSDPDAQGVNLLAPLLADRIVAVSEFARPRKPIASIESRFRVVRSPFEVPPPVDAAEARAALVREVGCDPRTRFVGIVGTLVERKRPVDLVEAIAHLKAAAPDLPVMGLAYGTPREGGPPLDEAMLRRAAELGVSDRIRLMGFRRPIERHIAALDVLAVPAMNEPFGRTLVEAMLLGTVVVAYRHGGNPEAIEDGRTGYLIDPGRPESFVSPILRLLRHEDERARMAEAAKRHALHAFSGDRHVKEIVSVYDDLRRST